jgi:ParB/RepB/Spo0J family partition protein
LGCGKIKVCREAAMSENILRESEPIEIPLAQIGHQYESLRIINPSSELSMLRSMEKYGQLSPLVVCRAQNNKYELIDGFKRLRVGRKLNKKSLKAKALNINPQAGKAAILQLNWVGKSISQMEEAMVLHSLYHDNGLSQVEIATLISRHKSFVCRRICLIEQLDDEVKESIKLGLIKVSAGWKLARLQRCNQGIVLLAIRQHRLSVRQTQELITALLSRPKCEHEALLRNPLHIVYSSPPLGKDKRLSQGGLILHKNLQSMQRDCLSITKRVSPQNHLTEGDILCLSPQIGQCIRMVQDTQDYLNMIINRSHMVQGKDGHPGNK